ncbi:SurA N-terminal domain-containing protein [Thermodesulfatator indicus]
MLDFLRQRAGSWLVKIILGAIIIVFVFWGVGTFRTGQKNILAEVNGQPITFTEFQVFYNQRLNQLRSLFGPQLNDELLKKLQLPAQVFEDLVRRKLMFQVAKEMGITVTTKELQIAISQIPTFQTNGRFDPRKYQLVLRELRLTPKEFEDLIKSEFIEAKIKSLLLTPIVATSEETKEWYIFQNEKLKILWAKLPISTCEKEVKINEKEIKSYYEANKERYKTKLKIALTYYFLPFKSLEKEIKITDKDLKNYYEAHKKEYTLPEERKLRHIFIARKKGESEEDFLKRAQEIRAKIKAPKDFAKVAAKYSDDPHTKDKGGELGWVKANEISQNLREVIFTAKEGEIIGPLRTPSGYHIFLIEKIKPAKTKSFEEVKEEIRKKLIETKLKSYAWDRAEKIYDKIVLVGGLKPWAQKENKTLVTTPLFSPDSPPPDNHITNDVISAALKLSEGELGPIMEVPEGILIFKLTKKEPPRIPPLEKIKDKVVRDLKHEKAQELCAEKAKHILEEAKKGNYQKVFKKYGLTFKESEFFTREDTEILGVPPQVLREAKTLANPGQWLDTPVLTGDAIYLVKLLEIKPADMTKFEEEKKLLQDLLTRQKREEAFNDWYKNLREKAEIKLYHELPKI